MLHTERTKLFESAADETYEVGIKIIMALAIILLSYYYMV